MAKVSVKSKGGWTGGGIFSFGISMGSENHEGESLSAIVDWINQSSFEKGIIDLSDTLNQYWFLLNGYNVNEAHEISTKQGDEWLARNLSILNKIGKPFEIIRWNHWRNHPEFKETLQTINEIFDQNMKLRMAIYADIAEFYARKNLSPSAGNLDISNKYFLEEMAGHTLLQKEMKCTAIYPGKQLESYKLIRSCGIDNFPDGIPGSAFVRLVPHSFEQKKLEAA